MRLTSPRFADAPKTRTNCLSEIPRFVPSLRIADMWAVLIKSGGPDPLREFSEAFAEFIGVRHAILAPSARGGLAAIVKALGFCPGSEVILPSLTFHSVPAVFHQAGLKVRFVDIDARTYCLDTRHLDRAISPRTVAIVPVHLYGRACEMDAILDISRRHNLVVIEDCAQACGTRYRGRRVGSLGTAGVFSFHVAKNLGALNFGMVTTDSDDLASRIGENLRDVPRIGFLEVARRSGVAASMDLATRPLVWGSVVAPVLRLCDRLGFDPIEAVTAEAATGDPGDVGRAPGPFQGRLATRLLRRLDEENERRRRNGERLRLALEGLPGIEVPAPSAEGENIYLSFVALVSDRKRFRTRLLAKGVDTHPGNMAVGPLIPGLASDGECAVARDVVRRLVHLPVHPGLSERDEDWIAQAVREVLRA